MEDNEKEKNKIPYRVKKIKIKLLALNYKKAKMKVSFYNSLHKMNENQENEGNDCQAFINYFDQILNSVSELAKTCIENEYINNNLLWYEKDYARATYYKIRRDAINEFFLYVK